MRYLLIDTANTFFRARHAAFRAADSWEKIGYALHITLSSINKVHRKFEALPSQPPPQDKFKSKLRPMQKFQDEINEVQHSQNLDALDLSMQRSN